VVMDSKKLEQFCYWQNVSCLPTSGEHFYLHLLLTTVTGATSFKYLCTFKGTLYPTFKDAYIVCGLLKDDLEWHQCLSEARHMATGYQLCDLFVTILRDCTPTDPRRLWEEFANHICDDLACQLARLHIRENPTPEEVRDYGLYLIEQLLSPSGKTLKNFQGMPQVTGNWEANLCNCLIAEQLTLALGQH
jgi:hypothetical protein